MTREMIIANLKGAREMYIALINTSPTSKACIFWGNRCIEYRAKLTELDAKSE